MGISLEIDSNVFLKNIHDAAAAKARAEGVISVLRKLLELKFGKLPKWATERLETATIVQAERWVNKLLTAGTLEGVLGQK